MKSHKQTLKLRVVQEQRVILRRVLFMTSSAVILLFLGLYISINLAEPGTVTASTASSQNRLVSH